MTPTRALVVGGMGGGGGLGKRSYRSGKVGGAFLGSVGYEHPFCPEQTGAGGGVLICCLSKSFDHWSGILFGDGGGKCYACCRVTNLMGARHLVLVCRFCGMMV